VNILFLIPLVLSMIFLIVSCQVTEEVELIGIRLVAILGLVVSLIVAPMWFKGFLLLWLFRSERSALLTSPARKF
jgi:membrane protein YdbS with pleckstrin-like domain